ncbi:MAG: aldose 1-epimerase [Acidimicrobiales bacterium]
MELGSSRAQARIDTAHGGRLCSLLIDGHEVLVTSDENHDPLRWGCYPMVPWAGRVRDGLFQWQGVEHRLPVALESHAIHGLGYTSQWRQVADDRIDLELGEPWPWSGWVESTFLLDDAALRWTIAVTNTDRSRWPVMVGWHPWFRRHIDGAEAALGFVAGSQMERDGAHIPTGLLIEPLEGPWDDCFSDVEQPVRIFWPGAVELELRSDCTHWVVYTEPDHALCVEPQSDGPDAFNRPTSGPESRDRAVSPNETFSRWFEIRWGR